MAAGLPAGDVVAGPSIELSGQSAGCPPAGLLVADVESFWDEFCWSPSTLADAQPECHDSSDGKQAATQLDGPAPTAAASPPQRREDGAPPATEEIQSASLLFALHSLVHRGDAAGGGATRSSGGAVSAFSGNLVRWLLEKAAAQR